MADIHLTGTDVLTADSNAMSGTGFSVLIFQNSEQSTIFFWTYCTVVVGLIYIQFSVVQKYFVFICKTDLEF